MQKNYSGTGLQDLLFVPWGTFLGDWNKFCCSFIGLQASTRAVFCCSKDLPGFNDDTTPQELNCSHVLLQRLLSYKEEWLHEKDKKPMHYILWQHIQDLRSVMGQGFLRKHLLRQWCTQHLVHFLFWTLLENKSKGEKPGRAEQQLSLVTQVPVIKKLVKYIFFQLSKTD